MHPKYEAAIALAEAYAACERAASGHAAVDAHQARAIRVLAHDKLRAAFRDYVLARALPDDPREALAARGAVYAIAAHDASERAKGDAK